MVMIPAGLLTKNDCASSNLPDSSVSWCSAVKWSESVRELIRGLLRLRPCELLLLEAGSWGRRQLGNPEEGERSPFEAVTRQRLVKTQQTKKT
jgi:hypothetical protein